jgi:hypothetical protein
MGGGHGGGYSFGGVSIHDNVKLLAKKYKLDSSSRFGTKGRGRAQVIFTDNPGKVASEFFEKLGFGGAKSDLQNGKGTMSKFKDGSHVVFRPKSSDGSPAVNITITTKSTDMYKIHFEPVESKKKGQK